MQEVPNGPEPLGTAIHNVFEIEKLELQKIIKGYTLEAHVSKYIDSKVGAEKLMKTLVRSNSFCAPVVTFVIDRRDTMIDTQRMASELRQDRSGCTPPEEMTLEEDSALRHFSSDPDSRETVYWEVIIDICFDRSGV